MCNDRTVVLFVNGIGDAILTIPTVRALRAAIPGRVTFLFQTWQGEVIFSEIPVEEKVGLHLTVNHEHVGFERFRFDVNEIVADIGPCTRFISLCPWTSTDIRNLKTRLNPRESIGLTEDYDIHFLWRPGQHEADAVFKTTGFLRLPLEVDAFAQPVILQPSAVYCAQKLLDKVGDNYKTLVVHTDTAPEKEWLNDRWSDLIDRFLRSHPGFIVIFVGSKISPSLLLPKHRAVNYTGLPLGPSLALVGLANVFIGIDSCMLHMADMSRVPGVGLFGTTDAREFGFRYGPNVTLQARGSLRQLAAEPVSDALDSLLSSPQQRTTWTL